MMTPAVLWHTVTQSFWINSPSITEKNVPDQTGRVHLVTGGNTGIGFELSQILYGANATVYLTSRDPAKGQAAIDRIKSAVPASQGRLELLQLDLADLPSVKKAAEEFKSRESKLHYLCNNAGLMMPPRGLTTVQGHDIEMGTNCLGPYLFTKLLTPLLRETAKADKEKGLADSVRVSWAGSLAIDMGAPPGGIKWDANGKPNVYWIKGINYGQSKAGNLFLSNIFAKEVANDGIVSVCFNPGNLRSELTRHFNPLAVWLTKLFMWPVIYGAYTELYCGVSPELTAQDNGIFVAPWGQKSWNRSDVEKGARGQNSEKFAEYCFNETKAYM